jgi:hypothetical protein
VTPDPYIDGCAQDTDPYAPRPACSTVVARPVPPPLPPLILRLAHLQPGSGSSGSTTTSALRAETVGRAAVGVADAGVKAGLVRLLFFNHLFLCNITTAAKSLTYETFACVAMWWFRGATPRSPQAHRRQPASRDAGHPEPEPARLRGHRRGQGGAGAEINSRASCPAPTAAAGRSTSRCPRAATTGTPMIF